MVYLFTKLSSITFYTEEGDWDDFNILNKEVLHGYKIPRLTFREHTKRPHKEAVFSSDDGGVGVPRDALGHAHSACVWHDCFVWHPLRW